jgi:hypothetical protein
MSVSAFEPQLIFVELRVVAGFRNGADVDYLPYPESVQQLNQIIHRPGRMSDGEYCWSLRAESASLSADHNAFCGLRLIRGSLSAFGSHGRQRLDADNIRWHRMTLIRRPSVQHQEHSKEGRQEHNQGRLSARSGCSPERSAAASYPPRGFVYRLAWSWGAVLEFSSRQPGINVVAMDRGSLAGNVAMRASFSASSSVRVTRGALAWFSI